LYHCRRSCWRGTFFDDPRSNSATAPKASGGDLTGRFTPSCDPLNVARIFALSMVWLIVVVTVFFGMRGSAQNNARDLAASSSSLSRPRSIVDEFRALLF
jgi:hypothetical protein